MPKHREAIKPLTQCSFCDRDQDDVAYLMSAPNGTAAICTDCAFGISIENVRWAGGIFAAMKADRDRSKTPAPRKIIVPPDERDAISEAAKKKPNGG